MIGKIARLIRQYLPDWLRPLARRVRRAFRAAQAALPGNAYAAKLRAERGIFDESLQTKVMSVVGKGD